MPKVEPNSIFLIYHFYFFSVGVGGGGVEERLFHNNKFYFRHQTNG